MGIKISDLTSATSLTGAEELVIVQGGNTKKTTISDILAVANQSRSIEQTRSTNSGSLVGSGEKSNLLLEELEEKEEQETKEKENPLPEEVEPSEIKTEGSGDER